MRALSHLRRSWPSIELPGYREARNDCAPYSVFAYDELPPIEQHLDDELHWLIREPVLRTSLADFDAEASTPANTTGLAKVSAEGVALPRAFAVFVGSEEPRSRIRSCTDCYLDLADFAISVTDGGRLVHFLADSQWALHWLLYSNADGAEAVLVTGRPLGYEVQDDDAETERVFDPPTGDAAVCAESFSEFLYRFWIENEIWFRLAAPEGPPQALSLEQEQYAEHYTRRHPP